MDVIVMGRGGFQAIQALGVPWPYPKPVVVLSSTLGPADVPSDLLGKVEVASEAPRLLFERLVRKRWRRAYVDGGAVIRSFVLQGMIADLTLTHVPILIGEGLPLFGRLPADIPLRHEATRTYPSGLVQSRYALHHVP
jgi:dihydrofolate reductase